MKQERDTLESELKRILAESEQKKAEHNYKCRPLSKTIEHTASQLRSFRQSLIDNLSQFMVEGVNSHNASQDKRKRTDGIVSSQRCFDEAMLRMKNEVKSLSLNQQPAGMPCPN